MAEQTQRLKVSDEKDVRIVEFVDHRILDEANIAEIGSQLGDLIKAKSRPKLLLDFSNVEHLSSAALGMLINVNNHIKLQNGQLRLTHIKPQILEVFSITRLDRLFRIFPTRKEGLESFSQ